MPAQGAFWHPSCFPQYSCFPHERSEIKDGTAFHLASCQKLDVSAKLHSCFHRTSCTQPRKASVLLTRGGPGCSWPDWTSPHAPSGAPPHTWSRPPWCYRVNSRHEHHPEDCIQGSRCALDAHTTPPSPPLSSMSCLRCFSTAKSMISPSEIHQNGKFLGLPAASAMPCKRPACQCALMKWPSSLAGSLQLSVRQQHRCQA